MTILLTILHVIVCLFLILVVLLQTGKGADLAGAFGGGGSQTAFGARGASTFLHKMTTTSAVLFMATSFVLAIVASRPSGSVVQDPSAPVTAPALDTDGIVPAGEPDAGTPAPDASEPLAGEEVPVPESGEDDAGGAAPDEPDSP